LEEVEVNGFQGCGQEIDLLKLISQCAPMLKKTTMMLSEETSASNDECAKI
uniref:FBD domain-containing protein n=2 Tax=Aegilops tauschii TaxID=37682 RepID=A0A453T6L8_AEGTS